MENIINKSNYPPLDSPLWLKRDDKGNYLVHYLAYQNNKLLVDVVKKHPKLLLIKNSNQQYIHFILAKLGYIDLLSSVLNHQIIDLIDDLTNSHITHYLVDYPRLLTQVLEKYTDININQINNRDETPLTMAISAKQFESFRVLCQCSNIEINENKKNPVLCSLLKSIKADFSELKKWFDVLEPLNPELDCSNYRSEYPLLLAYKSRNMKFFDFLVQKGCNLNYGGISRYFMIFEFFRKKDWPTIQKYEDTIDFDVRNLRWNTVFHDYLEKDEEPKIQELKYFLSKYDNLNSQNVDGRTICHLLDPKYILKLKSVFETKYINIFIKDRFKVKVLDIWNETKHFKKLIEIFRKGVVYNEMTPILDKIKTYSFSNLSKIEISSRDSVHLRKYNNNNNIYSAYIDNLIFYILAIFKRNENIYIAQKSKPLTFEKTNLDSEFSQIIKIRLGVVEELSKRMNNFIEYANKYSYYFPKLPKKFPSNKITFYILSLIGTEMNHTNIIIIDPFNKVIERFDSEGYFESDFYLDKILKKKFSKHRDLRDYSYIPINYEQNKNLYQLIETNLEDEKPGDPVGYCSAWSLWYLETRAMNYKISPEKLYEVVIKKLLGSESSIRDYIRNFSVGLAKFRNEFLKENIDSDNRNTNYLDDSENEIMRKKIDELIKN